MSPFGRASRLAAGLRLLTPQPGEVPSFGVVGGMQEAGRSLKGLRGVYGFSFWSLIECLEDKLSDISHPSGQRMGG